MDMWRKDPLLLLFKGWGVGKLPTLTEKIKTVTIGSNAYGKKQTVTIGSNTYGKKQNRNDWIQHLRKTKP